LLPVIALLLFGGGGVLGDFAFALLIGIASGAYSSIFIASPVLTHWKEREAGYRARRERILAEVGHVPAYAAAGADVEPVAKRPRRTGRLTAPEPETVSRAEFEQMKRELEIEEEEAAISPRQTSTLTKRLAHTTEPEPPAPVGRRARADGAQRARQSRPKSTASPQSAERTEVAPDAEPQDTTPLESEAAPPAPAPDIPENEGVAPAPKPRPKPRSRNRRHGRRR
jgi:SecD/SecF fusion protein